MLKPFIKTTVLIILITLVGACEPAATSIPPTATVAPAPPTIAPTPAVDSQVINLETAAQLGREIVFDQSASFVHTVAFSPDGRYLIAVDQNGDVVIKKVETWKEHQRFTTQADIASASLSPDGTMIVTGGAAGNVVAWDLTGNELFSIPYSGAVFCTQFSPDGRYLAVGGENDQVMIVDVATQQKVTDLVSDHQYVSNLVFSPDSKTLLVGHERPENAIKIWDTSTWEESATFSHVTERIDYHDLVFSPDGRYLVVASTQNAIKFLDVTTWQVVKEFEGHTRGTYQVIFSLDGSLLVSACDDGSLRLWDVETGDSIKTIRGYRENVAIDLSPDGALIAFSGWGEGVQVWAVSPAATSSSPAPTPAPQAAADVSPIALDSAADVELLYTLSGHSDRVITLAFSGDGAYIASSSRDETIKLWNLQSGQEVHAFSMDEVVKNGIAFSPDGSLLASPDAIWDVESRQVVHTLERGRHVPALVAFSHDGSLLAVALGDQPIKLWDVASGQVMRTFDNEAYNVARSIEFSPDDALLAEGGNGGTVRLWDVENGHIAGILEHGNESHIHDVAFSPDGSVLASGGTDYTVRLWDVASGQAVHTLRHQDCLYSVAFSPDGTILAAAGCERTVRLWDVENGRMLRALPHDDELMAVAFSPDGTLLASGGYDNQVYLWGIPH